MHPWAVGLVLVSACLHVVWNFLVKRSAIGALMVLPFGFQFLRQGVPWQAVAFACGTGVCYAGYYTLMSVSYRSGELSSAYPITRGVAPTATALIGVSLMGERPSLIGAVAIVLVVVAVFLLGSDNGEGKRLSTKGLLAAIATGLCSAGYSLIDKNGVQWLNPVAYLSLSFGAGFILQAPLTGKLLFKPWSRGEVVPLLIASAACAFGYLLVLVVLKGAPASYVVPLRASSVLISLFVGRHLLKEGLGWRKLTAAGLIMVGIIGIALA